MLISPVIQRVLIILSASVLFGLSWPAARGAYLDGANNVFVILVTTFFRMAVLVGFCAVQRQRLFATPADIKISFQSGLVQAISVFGILGSMVYLPAPVAIVILFTSTIMLLFLLWFKGEIQINKWLLITTILCMVGIGFVVDVWHASLSDNIIGYVLITIGAIATASRMYIFGKQTQHKKPAVVGAETFLFASLFLLLLLFYKLPEAPHSVEGYGWAVLSGVSAGVATLAMFFGIAKAGAFHFSLYNKLEPVFGCVFSAILIGEILKSTQYMGMFIVIVSLVGYQIWDHHNKKRIGT